MTIATHTFRLAVVGAALVAAAISAPFAAADPPAIPAPIPKASAPRLGERLSGRDRAWLTRASEGAVPRLGEQLSGADRSWLATAATRAPRYAQVTDPWALNLFARQSYGGNELTTAGPHGTVSVVSPGGFDWTAAGIGAAFVFGITLVGAASLTTIRRHHGPAAH